MQTQRTPRKQAELAHPRLVVHTDEPVPYPSSIALTDSEKGTPEVPSMPFPLGQFMDTLRQDTERLIESALTRNEHHASIFVKANDQIINLRMQEILWVEAYGDYVNFQTTKSRYLVHATMKAIENKLPASQFARVHRSFIVRMDKIDLIDESLIQMEKKLIPIGESYKSDLMSRLNVL